jgi:hypothetical protein
LEHSRAHAYAHVSARSYSVGTAAASVNDVKTRPGVSRDSDRGQKRSRLPSASGFADSNGGNSRERRPKRIRETRRWAREPGTPRPCWRELPWWPAFELGVTHGLSVPIAAAWAVAQAPGPLASTRTLYRFAARLFTEWIWSNGLELTDAKIAWARRRHMFPVWYDCTCQDKARCPNLPPPHTGRHDKRSVNGRFEPNWVGSSRTAAGA